MQNSSEIRTIKGKPRGRPFKKVLAETTIDGDILEASRHEADNIAKNALNSLDKLLINKQDEIIQENLILEKKEQEKKLIETIDFFSGNNKLSISLFQCHNRMFRMQIFLNDRQEIRPVTYTGSSTSYAFWNMLKESLNYAK